MLSDLVGYLFFVCLLVFSGILYAPGEASDLMIPLGNLVNCIGNNLGGALCEILPAVITGGDGKGGVCYCLDYILPISSEPIL